jgi:hypothetical protein
MPASFAALIRPYPNLAAKCLQIRGTAPGTEAPSAH